SPNYHRSPSFTIAMLTPGPLPLAPRVARMGGQVFMRKPFLVIAAAILAILTACSGTPPDTATAKKEPEKPVSVTGQSALYRMYQMARSWSSDAQVLRLASLHINEAPDGPPGAAAAWQATFTSASKGRSRGYTFSIVESEGNLHKGPFAGPEQ